MQRRRNIHNIRGPQQSKSNFNGRLLHFHLKLFFFFVSFGGVDLFLVLGCQLHHIHASLQLIHLILLCALSRLHASLLSLAPFGHGRKSNSIFETSQVCYRHQIVNFTAGCDHLIAKTGRAQILSLCHPLGNKLVRGSTRLFHIDITLNAFGKLDCQTTDATLLDLTSNRQGDIGRVPNTARSGIGELSRNVIEFIGSEQECKQNDRVKLGGFVIILPLQSIAPFLVVNDALVIVGKNLVCFSNDFELLGRFFVPRIFIWVVLLCQFVVLSLDGSLVSIRGNIQSLIIKHVHDLFWSAVLLFLAIVQVLFHVAQQVAVVFWYTFQSLFFGFQIGFFPLAVVFIPVFSLTRRNELLWHGGDASAYLHHAGNSTSNDHGCTTKHTPNGSNGQSKRTTHNARLFGSDSTAQEW
mmetsp:Transcript_9615/g.20678  ORF Transcript_9615/g.20678 Transcript_9615/m.20678 type:complete len:410 (-) Transcript_9615:312-1541(-)